VTLLAISKDTPDDSRAFARDYGLRFSLLADEDGAVSSVYAGVTSDSETLPGITIVRPDGSIAFRQAASAKDDRMSAAELLATIDRSLGTSGPSTARSGYAAIDRAQLRVDLGGGGVDTNATRGTVTGDIAGLLAFGRYVLAGVELGFEPREAPLDLDAMLVVRAPFWRNTGAFELGLSGGYTPWGDTGGNAAVRGGVWFAVSPRWAVQLAVGAADHGLGTSTQSTEVFATLGLGRLFQIR
jgi:hypothetical protein